MGSEDSGMPCALWRLVYDDARHGAEDLEELEVLDAILAYGEADSNH